MLMKICSTAVVAILVVSLSPFAAAQKEPAFMRETLPNQAVAAAFDEFQAIMEDAALDQKTKELIGLGVAAQIPCEYCVDYHTTAAKSLGATNAEIKEAIATAALVRKWSTMLNGSQYDAESWHAELEAMFANK
jgi:AhpD family alkylhydroperoxidase